MNKVFLQYWEESERGFGTRPDGASLYIDDNAHKIYLEKIYKNRDFNNIPHEYDRTVGIPIHVEVVDDLFNIILEKKILRLWQTELSNLIKLKSIIL